MNLAPQFKHAPRSRVMGRVRAALLAVAMVAGGALWWSVSTKSTDFWSPPNLTPLAADETAWRAALRRAIEQFRSVSPTVAGGVKVADAKSKFPSLMTVSGSELCLATAVGSRVILTAAHCVHQSQKWQLHLTCGSDKEKVIDLICPPVKSGATSYPGYEACRAMKPSPGCGLDVALCTPVKASDAVQCRGARAETLGWSDPKDVWLAGRDINNYLYDGQMLFDGFASQTEFKAKKGQAPNDIVATSGDSGTAAFNKFDVGRIVLGVATQVYGNNDGNRFVRLSAVKDLFVNWENEQQMLAKICGLSEDAKNCRP